MKNKLIKISIITLGLSLLVASLLLEYYSLLYVCTASLLAVFFLPSFKELKTLGSLKRIVEIFLVTVIFVGMIFVSTKPYANKVFDITSNKQNTLSDQTKSILSLVNKKHFKVNFRAYYTNEKKINKVSALLNLYDLELITSKVRIIDPIEDPIQTKKDMVTKNETLVMESKKLPNRMLSNT